MKLHIQMDVEIPDEEIPDDEQDGDLAVELLTMVLDEVRNSGIGMTSDTATRGSLWFHFNKIGTWEER